MKKRLIFSSLLVVFWSSGFAQISFPNQETLQQFQKSKTYIVLLHTMVGKDSGKQQISEKNEKIISLKNKKLSFMLIMCGFIMQNASTRSFWRTKNSKSGTCHHTR
jgi:hypothetical protein